jgi:hypothetical protein
MFSFGEGPFTIVQTNIPNSWITPEMSSFFDDPDYQRFQQISPQGTST